MQHLKLADGQGASNKTPRHINSSLVLKTVRRRQPISRADLARISGLQPSTISLIAEELIQSGWLLEGEAVKSARGRRPRLLTLAHQRCVIALDIHPSQTTVAIADIAGRIAWQSAVDLPDDPKRAIGVLIGAIRNTIKAQPDKTFEGIGICLPGRTDLRATELIFAPNLRSPIVSLKSKIQRATGLQVEMDNVANACALSEVWFGDSDGKHDLVVVEVSEGLGTGIFLNGAIARGEGGMAGEFGHIQMVEDGPMCNCGNSGCWETLASNRAAVRYYRESPDAKSNINFTALLRLVLAGEPVATAALHRVAANLGRGMGMIVAALAPTEIIVVGEITAAWHEIGPIVDTYMRKNPLAKTTRLRPAYDGASARLRSAVALVLGKDLYEN